MFKKFFLFIFITFLAGSAGALSLIPHLTHTVAATAKITSKEDLMNRNNTGVILLDRNGTPFYRLFDAHHTNPVTLAEVPTHLRNAVIAAEDKEFYTHPGYSIRSTAAALVANIRHGEIAYGGSTITQQLVKNILLNPQRDLRRKYQEVLLARELEERFSKDEILEMYLNSVYFGEGAFGVADAAQAYFNKPVAELDLAQSSLLAGIIVAPSRLSPISGDRESALARQKEVLASMLEQGFITSEEKTTAETTTLAFSDTRHQTFSYYAHHFAHMVRDELISRYGEEKVARSGYVVRTSLDLAWQEQAETIVREQVEKIRNQNVSNGAAVVIDPKTGEIRAMVGSVDWNNPQFGKVNVTTATRQAGSAFKPVVYLTGLEKQVITPASMLRDVPTTFGKDYKPLNYDGRFRGNVTTRQALATSLNVPAVSLLQQVSVPSTLDMAARLGITTLKNFSSVDLSLALGSGEVRPLELTNAYATIANQGRYNPATSILEIVDKFGEQVYQYTPPAKQVVEPRYTFLLTSILSDNEARREVFRESLTISRPAAVKTGTTQTYRDSWTIGFTPDLAIGVWVGNNDSTPMHNVAGSLGAAPIWRSLMETFHKDLPVTNFTAPAGVQTIEICRSNGLRATFTAPPTTRQEYFADGTEPTTLCNRPTPPPTPEPTPTPEPEQPMPEPPMILEGVGGEAEPTALPQPSTPVPVPTPIIIPQTE